MTIHRLSCTATVDEYRMALLMGQVDVDSNLEKFNAEMQKQFDEFLASK